MKKYLEFVNEDISNFEDKITGDFKSLKRGVLELIDNTIKSSDLVDYQNFIDKYLNNSDTIVEGFVEDNEIFDFYLKYKGDIDELLADREFFEEPARDNDVFSLYDYIITGTKKAFVECLQILQDEIF
jgi:hypothetical protein